MLESIRDEMTDINEVTDIDLTDIDVKSFNFYQLVELLLQLSEHDPEDEDWERQCQFVFKSNPSLGFSTSDVSGLDQKHDDRLELETTFLGLTGSQSPLPGYLLEQVLTEGEFGLRGPFLDFFNNRMITLVYRIWRKYRYYIRFQEGASDDFSAQLFALVGLADRTCAAKRRSTGARCSLTPECWLGAAVHRKWCRGSLRIASILKMWTFASGYKGKWTFA